MTYDKAKEYLLSLKYAEWHKVSDIPEEFRVAVIDLIDENFRCKYLFNDNNEFMKV